MNIPLNKKTIKTDSENANFTRGFIRTQNSKKNPHGNFFGDTQKKPNLVRGFTLIETLVAVAIFATAITGLIAITASGIANTNFVKNKFTAGYLAMEGAELIHNIRDTVSISNPSGGWSAVLSELDYCISSEFCYVDPWTISTPVACPNEGCPPMTYTESSGHFSYDSIDGLDSFASIFTRSISIESISPSEITVTSRVDWIQGTKTHSVSYEYNLSNWINP